MSYSALTAYCNHRERLQKLRDELRGAENYVEFSLRWASTLEHIKLATSALVRLGMDAGGKATAAAERYKNLQRTDPVLTYLKSARDAQAHEDERGFAQVSKENDPYFSIGGGAIRISPGANIQMTGNIINGLPFIGEFSSDPKNPWVRWDPRGAHAAFEPRAFTLETVLGRNGKKKIAPPERNGAVLSPLDCLDYATSSLGQFHVELLNAIQPCGPLQQATGHR